MKLLVLISAFSAALAAGASPGTIDILEDFTKQLKDAVVDNAEVVSGSGRESSGGIALPGFFIHPKGDQDARVTFPQVRTQRLAGSGQKGALFLLFSVGFRDGIPWELPAPNGVRFSIDIAGREAYSEAVRGIGWQPRVLDLGAMSEEVFDVAFRVNAIDANTAYDWAVFGDPLLVSIEGVGSPGDLPQEAAGVALAHVTAAQETEAKLSLGALQQTLKVFPGDHWFAQPFSSPGDLQITGEDLQVGEILYAQHLPHLLVEAFALGSPLLIAGEPFNAVLEVRNAGRGNQTGSLPLRLSVGGREFPAELGAVKAGDAVRVIWKGLEAPEAGNCLVDVLQDQPQFAVTPLHAHVFPSRIAPDPATPVYEQVVDTEEARLVFVKDSWQEVYAELFVKRGEALQRMGSIYPLADGSLIVGGETRAPRQYEATLKSSDLKASGARAVVTGTIAGEPVEVTVEYAGEGRFSLKCQLNPGEETEVMALRGPRVLAGDHAFGVAKRFAIFPGLEYLEGEEASSSERDLANPLSERRVPARHKIATPLMAVEGEGALISLMWDMHQPWAQGEQSPAAYFNAPAVDSGYTAISMNLFAPSVGAYVQENTQVAFRPFLLKAGQNLSLECQLVLEAGREGTGAHPDNLVLHAFDHYFDTYGWPEPSAPPRDWEEERQLCLYGYFEAVWSEEPPGWRHCYSWQPGLFVGHAVPQLLLKASVPDDTAARIETNVGKVLERALAERGPEYLWSNAGCHIMLGELPFFWGYPLEALEGLRAHATRLLDARENGRWVWRPGNDQLAALGNPGDHTLGQAALPSFVCLRAARLSGDQALAQRALEAMRQMEEYAVPRGAQTWECPLYQPDILASAFAIRAYCEAYRLTGDAAHLAQAQYWARTGLPFLYLWDMPDYPTMRYNVISVFGSTHFTHSWIGLPVVWCGLVYAYALQDLAELGGDGQWKQVAEGITNSAMWQQYTEGPERGTYPDSWNMIGNKPNPADINPENILVNALRLRGISPEIDSQRMTLQGAQSLVNSAASIRGLKLESVVDEERLEFRLVREPAMQVYTVISNIPEPLGVAGSGQRVDTSSALKASAEGWQYDAGRRALVLKQVATLEGAGLQIVWKKS